MTIDNSISRLNSNILEMLSNASIIKLENFIYNHGNELNFTRFGKLAGERKKEYYELLHTAIITTNIQEENLFTNKIKLYGENYKYYPSHSSNLRIENIDLSYFVNTSIKTLLFYLNFLEEFYKNISEYVKKNYKIDSKIYSHKFEILCNYELSAETGKLVSLNYYYKIAFKLNRRYFEESTGDPFIFTDDTQITDAIDYLLENVDDFKSNIDIVNPEKQNWENTKIGYIKYGNLKLKLNHILLVLLYTYVFEKPNWLKKVPNLIKVINSYNILLESKTIEYSYQKKLIDDHLRNLDTNVEESEKIKEAINKTKKLKNINNNIQDNANNLYNMNTNIELEQSKLNKINTVFIVAILLFILLSILLMFIKYAKRPLIYSVIIITILLYIIIYFYISSIKKNSKMVEKFETDRNKEILNNSDLKMKNLMLINSNTFGRTTKNTYSYYDVINPLLNNELKHFQNKEYKNKLYDKLAQFNLNVSKRDIKYNIETIIFLMNLSLLLLLLIISMYYKPELIILCGSIALILFILLAILYFARILRVVRTKSNNFYWNKPVKEKEII